MCLKGEKSTADVTRDVFVIASDREILSHTDRNLLTKKVLEVKDKNSLFPGVHEKEPARQDLISKLGEMFKDSRRDMILQISLYFVSEIRV